MGEVCGRPAVRGEGMKSLFAEFITPCQDILELPAQGPQRVKDVHAGRCEYA